MLRWQVNCLVSLALLLLVGMATAEDVPAITGEPLASSQAELEAPGFSRVVLDPVTPEQYEQAIHARSLPAELTATPSADSSNALRVSGDAAPAGPASLQELARSLKNDPDLIYEYVRNNIEYYPVWGVQKGALGALIDNQGTAFDQAALMVALLRESGYTASYVIGKINPTPAQVQAWLGIGDLCAASDLLTQGSVPKTVVGCSGSQANFSLSHVWVKATIGGTDYYFDPSFKPHTVKAGIGLNGLADASSYDATDYLDRAKSGATTTPDYIQGVNRGNIGDKLKTYATNLANYLRLNQPAGDLDDLIGGKTIIPHAGGNLRQANLPHQDTSAQTTEWAEIPINYKPTLNIKVLNQGIDKTYLSDEIYGKRLTITYNGSNQPVLMLDGQPQATGTAIANPISNVAFTITHPYAVANRSHTQLIRAGGTYLISNGWGPAGRGLIEFHRKRLEAAKAAGLADNSEAVLGSSLAVLSATWIAEADALNYIIDRLAKTHIVRHHRLGIAGYNGASYVDLPGNLGSFASEDGDANQATNVFLSSAMHSSIFESMAVQQTTGVSAVSTVKLLDLAAMSGDKIYNATSTNYDDIKNNQLQAACANYVPSTLNATTRLILPTRCDLGEGNWSGTGYFSISSSGGQVIGLLSAINGGLALAGGFATSNQSASDFSLSSLTNQVSAWANTLITGSFFNDPIDMTKGTFAYSHDDITVGVGGFPHALSFQTLYSSGLRNQDGPLGKGWTHNFAATATMGSDGFQGLGEDSALDAVNTIAEVMVSLDLLSDPAKPLDKMVIATLGMSWFGDQLLDNTVTVKPGLNGELFVKLPDGKYNPPPGNAARLFKKANNTYGYETLHRDQLNFDADGKIATLDHASGVQVKFSYSGTTSDKKLTQVENSLGRKLTFTTTAGPDGRITGVSDGIRSVAYGYVAGNLETFTDANAQITTFKYKPGLPGLITQLFYPSNPTIAFATNVYDSLDRVQTQTDANDNKYTYYFAGSRSEETGPLGLSRVSYVDAFGKILKSIDPLGRVTTNDYDGQERLVETVLPEGNKVKYVYADGPCSWGPDKRCTHNVKTVNRIPKPGSGQPTLTSSYTYEGAFNHVKTATDARGNTTDYTYTDQGQPFTVTRPADADGVRPMTTYGYISYTPAGYPAFYLPASITELTKQTTTATNAVVTATAYYPDKKYVPANTTVDAGTGKLRLKTTYIYDAVGNLTTVNGPRNDVTDAVDVVETDYDDERRPTIITDALGKQTLHAYYADGRLARTAAQIGTEWLVSCRSYTSRGKLKRTLGPFLSTDPVVACPDTLQAALDMIGVAMSDYSYDELGRLQRVTERLPVEEGGDRVTDTVYNLDDSVKVVKRAVGSLLAQSSATYTYTGNGLVETVKDAKGNLTTYHYDGHDRKHQTLFPEAATANTSSLTDYEEYGYDANGNLTDLRTRRGDTVSLAYDNLNRLTGRTYSSSAANDNVSYSYDLLGRRLSAQIGDPVKHTLSYVWDNAGRLKSTKAGGLTLSHQYDPADNLTRTTWPGSPAFYITRSYDALNRPDDIFENGTVILAHYAYDDLSRRSTVTLGNGTTTTYGYNDQSALDHLAHNLTYTGRDNTWTYTRNRAQEITGQIVSNEGYQWDGYGDSGSQSYTLNGLNQYTDVAGTALNYDDNGNLASYGEWAYTYNPDNRLKSANKPGLTASLLYDAEGRLRQTTIDSDTADTLAGITTRLLYAGSDLIAEYDGANILQRRYVHGPGVDEPLVWYEGADTTHKTWLYADHQGSIVATANATGQAGIPYRYGPYGEPDRSTGVRFRYTGQQYIAPLNLYYYKARFYSADLGRFLQTDPIGYGDGLNLYAYVGNNPINRTDPSGEAKVALEFGLGFAPGYDLYQATQNPNASALDYGIGILGVIPGLGKGSGLALKYGDDLVDLYRAVNPTELANIQKTGAFTSLYGLEGKYFTTSGQQASTYAREAVNAFGDAPYTIVKTQAPQSILETPGISATIEKGIKAYQIPNQSLLGLKPEILNHSPIP